MSLLLLATYILEELLAKVTCEYLLLLFESVSNDDIYCRLNPDIYSNTAYKWHL